VADSSFTFTGAVRPICEVGMSASRAAEPDSWFDASCYVHEAEIFRGRQRFTDRFEPATASITFDNRTGWGDLVGAPLIVAAATLRPGRPLRIGVVGSFDGGPLETRWLFRGWIDQATPAYDPVLHDVVTVNCIDSFGESGQSIAPAGPEVGVNETTAGRVNRVLDAVGWFPTKRKISAVTTAVQGTTLGVQAADLMTAAADSAGGVVYGDLDGDVVLRGLDWELYSAAAPPDGEIGNVDPGTPPLPDTPVYIDPVLGYVYQPDPPPFEHPEQTVLKVCANGTAGTLIEQPPAYRLYAADGRLLFESSGQVWDMGVYEGGCTGVIVDPHPIDGQPPVQRIDAPQLPPEEGGGPQDDAWVISEEPVVEVPPGGGVGGGDGDGANPVFGVELLGYSDGGLADGPQSTVTVAGINPGPDAMLVVLVCAICSAVPAGSLTPFPVAGGSITGAGMTFDEVAREPAGGDGAESYGAVARTPRTDPGVFDVVVDWSGANQSRYHIVTVWRVTAERQDLLERMKLGAYRRSFTWDRTGGILPSPNPPGKGFWQTAFEDTGSDVPPYARLADITIAQTLAESPTEPWGATFNTADGEWWTPTFGDIDPVVRAVPGPVWRDDFERADGPLGSDWLDPAGIPVDTAKTTVGIVSGAVEVGVDPAIDDTAVNGFGQTLATIEAGAAQYVEVAITNVFQGHPVANPDPAASTPADMTCDLLLFSLASDTDASSASMECGFGWGGNDFEPGKGFMSVHVRRQLPDGSTDYGPGFANVDYPDHDPARVIVVRFESSPQGAQRCLVDGVQVMESNVGALDGLHLGFGLHWSKNLPAGTSPRINYVEIGVAELGIIRKCSWVAGTRPASSAPDVKFDTVNVGPDDIQSSQACVIVEPETPNAFGWRTLAYYSDAPVPPTTVPPMSHSSTVRYERSSILLVFVAAFAGGDVASGITVTSSGLTFAAAKVQGWDGVGHGQGAVFWAKTPELAHAADAPPVVTVSWGAALDGVTYLVYEATGAGAVAATGGAVRGTHVLGSVDGGVTALLSAPPDTASVTLGFLGVLGDANESGATPGVDFTEEVEVLPSAQRAWLQAQSRTSSTSAAVNWVDMNASSPTGPKASDAVVLAVEVTPGPDFVMWGTDQPVEIGGGTDAFNGPIYFTERSTGTDPNGGDLLWGFGGGPR
jgi:hypothetical protein